MSNNRPITINGRTYDFTSIRPSGLPGNLDSSLFTGYLMGLNYSQKVTPSVPAGVHGIPLPSGRGIYTCSTSIEVVFEFWDALTQKLPDGYTDFDFNLTIQYKAKGRACKVEWIESRFIGDDASHNRGSSNGLTAKVEMYTRYILINGKCLYPLDLDQDVSAQNNDNVDVGIA